LDDVIALRKRRWVKIKKDDIGRKEGERNVKKVVSVPPPRPVVIAKPTRNLSKPNDLSLPMLRQNPVHERSIPSPVAPSPDRSSVISPPLPSPERPPSAEKRDQSAGRPTSQLPVVNERKVDELIEEYLTVRDDSEAAECVKELGNPASFSLIITRGLLLVVEKKEKEKQYIMQLFDGLFKAKLLETSHFLAAFKSCFDQLPDIAIDCPVASEFFGQAVGNAIHHGWIPSLAPLKEWTRTLDSRVMEGVYGGTLSHIAEMRDSEFLLSKLKECGFQKLGDLFPQKKEDELRSFAEQYHLDME
jgi:hypothetical protein